MRNAAWNDLIALIEGKKLGYQPVGFIIDSPWIPGWYGISKVDYYSSDELWLKANLKANSSFPDVWFLPSMALKPLKSSFFEIIRDEVLLTTIPSMFLSSSVKL